jgi:hypothetical protein
MIAVSISAALLVAVAGAFHATSDAIEVNDEFTRASQAARISMNQIMAEVRRCKSGTAGSSSLDLVTATDERRVYAYDATTRQLTMTLPDNVPPTTYTLARNVHSATFNTEGQTIALTMVVKIGNNQIKLSSSGMPRRTVSFN